MINALGNTKWYIEKNIDISYLYFGDLFFVFLITKCWICVIWNKEYEDNLNVNWNLISYFFLGLWRVTRQWNVTYKISVIFPINNNSYDHRQGPQKHVTSSWICAIAIDCSCLNIHFLKNFQILFLSYNVCVYLWQDLLLIKVSQGKGTRLVISSNAKQ